MESQKLNKILPWEKGIGRIMSSVQFRRPVNERDTPLRLIPRDGDPRCFLELTAQIVWTFRLHLLILITVILILVEEVWNWPIPKKS